MLSFTINTDASFSRKFRRGAGAYWIKGDDYSSRKSFMFPQQLHSSFIAELLTFERAFQEGYRQHEIEVTGQLATDNQVATPSELSCCGWPLDDDGFCHGCWEHCV